jgi:hypothetical protein
MGIAAKSVIWSHAGLAKGWEEGGGVLGVRGGTFVSIAAKPNSIDPTSLKSPGLSSAATGGTYFWTSCGLRGSPESCNRHRVADEVLLLTS